jgi:hypothetical protein
MDGPHFDGLVTNFPVPTHNGHITSLADSHRYI